jgi:hypothetical protein
MKRAKIILPIALFLILVLVLLTRLSKSDPNAPRFVPALTQPTGPFGFVYDDFNGDVPFPGGKAWITAVLSSTNHHGFLYDLDKRLVLGELVNASEAFCNQDHSKMLCKGFSPPVTSLKEKLFVFLNKVSNGKILLLQTNNIETFWILDLKSNSSRRIGTLSQIPGAGSRWRPAPGFRYGYNVPSNFEVNTFFLCDLEDETFTKIKFSGELRGWWDDHSILSKDSNGDFVLFNVVTRQTNPLFSGQSINKFLSDSGITNDPAGITTLLNWNGHDYDLYFAGNRKTGLDTNTTFLIKVDRNGPTLKLLYRDFQFRWSGWLDASATHYLYSGENGTPGNGGNGGVFLRDLVNNTTRTIVEPDNSGQYALARLYSNSVIYSHNRVLWRVDLDTTNTTSLLPQTTN